MAPTLVGGASSTSAYNFKRITPVPTCSDFIDIVLSRTQRKTPTVVHKHYQISRIRAFYMRKVKFTNETFDEKLGKILEDFPKLDDIHPFYADLMNVLYDRDHYKLALAQINTARNLIANVGRDYVRLLKFGDSLYRCKQLKKAALGRMATIMKRQKETLAYLDQVRQHLSRLPSIDPNTRTLMVCGYPNVGKSSFINKMTRAEVEVQPYAFTTKSLFVGHMDYKYLRWQVIDTPGILDHPLEERNTIEMLSITALAHLRACVLYFIDLTEQCGYTIKQQVDLLHSIKPLFANKPFMLMINKIDTRSLDDLTPEENEVMAPVLAENTHCLISCHSEIGLMEAKAQACDKLLASRVESKLRVSKTQSILDRIHVAVPVERDDQDRPPFIPDAFKSRIAYDAEDPCRRKLEKDLEKENGGAGVFNVDLKKRYLLDSEEWRYDIIPEIMDGHNVADFIDPDIEAKLEALEREEEEMEAGGHYERDEEMDDEQTTELKALSKEIRQKKQLIIQQHRAKKANQNPQVPQKVVQRKRTARELQSEMTDMGLEVGHLTNSDSVVSRMGRKRARSMAMDTDMDPAQLERIRTHSRVRDRSMMGVNSKAQKLQAENISHNFQRPLNRMAKAGEADRAIKSKMPKHLFAGKRGGGKTDRR